MYRLHFPRSALNKRGYPHWDRHKANELLVADVANWKNKEMKPKELQQTRDEYKPFPLKVFGERVHAEVRKQKADAFWTHKRNKKNLKKHVMKDVEFDAFDKV